MKKLIYLGSMVMMVLVMASCSQDPTLVLPPDTVDSQATFNSELAAGEVILQSGWTFDEDVELPAELVDLDLGKTSGCITDFSRELVVDDIYHYRYTIRIGAGPYDVIGLHRVVKERRPYRPIRTRKNVFLLHGDAVGFVKFIFGSATPNLPDDYSFATYLAQNNVDVWGMDQDWILVPAEETDFSFMADWGLQHQIDNLDVGLTIARLSRLFSGGGMGKMKLLGYSSGATTGWAYMNQQSQAPRWRRQVDGYIPVDVPYKLGAEDEAGRVWSCEYAAQLQAAYDSGVYSDETGGTFIGLSELAGADPAGVSPIFPGLTNLQAALYLMAVTHDFLPLNDYLHYMGGVFEEGLPVGLLFTDVDVCLDFMASASPYEPLAFVMDYIKVFCDEEDLVFDDFLADITEPIMYVGANGGLGQPGIHTTTLVGSEDVTVLNVSLMQPEYLMVDIGHIDIWTAVDSDVNFWLPMLDWIVDHSHHHAGADGRVPASPGD